MSCIYTYIFIFTYWQFTNMYKLECCTCFLGNVTTIQFALFKFPMYNIIIDCLKNWAMSISWSQWRVCYLPIFCKLAYLDKRIMLIWTTSSYTDSQSERNHFEDEFPHCNHHLRLPITSEVSCQNQPAPTEILGVLVLSLHLFLVQLPCSVEDSFGDIKTKGKICVWVKFASKWGLIYTSTWIRMAIWMRNRFINDQIFWEPPSPSNGHQFSFKTTNPQMHMDVAQRSVSYVTQA